MHRICTALWETGEWPGDWMNSVFVPIRKKGDLCIGVDLGGSRGTRPPIIESVGQRYPFAPPIIQLRIFENIETTSETKTRNLTRAYYQIYIIIKTIISIIYTL